MRDGTPFRFWTVIPTLPTTSTLVWTQQVSTFQSEFLLYFHGIFESTFLSNKGGSLELDRASASSETSATSKLAGRKEAEGDAAFGKAEGKDT